MSGQGVVIKKFKLLIFEFLEEYRYFFYFYAPGSTGVFSRRLIKKWEAGGGLFCYALINAQRWAFQHGLNRQSLF